MSVKEPVTPAVRILRQYNVPYVPHIYPYKEHGGTAWSSEVLGLPHHHVIKTLVFQSDTVPGLVVLMHGDCEVSNKNLARQLNARRVDSASIDRAERLTGYKVGGISPFGQRTPMPIYVEESILSLPQIAVNGGARGFLVQIDPQFFLSVLQATPVNVAIEK